ESTVLKRMIRSGSRITALPPAGCLRQLPRPDRDKQLQAGKIGVRLLVVWRRVGGRSDGSNSDAPASAKVDTVPRSIPCVKANSWPSRRPDSNAMRSSCLRLARMDSSCGSRSRLFATLPHPRAAQGPALANKHVGVGVSFEAPG